MSVKQNNGALILAAAMLAAGIGLWKVREVEAYAPKVESLPPAEGADAAFSHLSQVCSNEITLAKTGAILRDLQFAPSPPAPQDDPAPAPEKDALPPAKKDEIEAEEKPRKKGK